MRVIYNTGIIVYGLIIRLVALFNPKARLFLSGRKNWKKKLKTNVDPDAQYLWFHCASLGEFEQGRPVIEEIRNQFPEYKIALTFFSPSGYEIRKNYEGADLIMYLPLDTPSNARYFVEILHPQKAFFVKYEYWVNYITTLKKNNIPLIIFSAIFRKEQLFFKKSFIGKWFQKLLINIEHFFVQNQNSVDLLQSIGLSNASISGDTRFDRVAAIAETTKPIELVEKFKGNQQLVVAGSTWPPDEELLVQFINKNKQTKFIIAPHEVNEANINRIVKMLKTPSVLYSRAQISDVDTYQVLIIDSIGLLSSLYKYSNLAYVGGGFGVGIHNILEAATFGTPIVFGPKFQKFAEAVSLTKLGGAFSIRSLSELNDTFSQLLSHPKALKNSSEVCRNYVEKNVGSSKFIIKKVFNNRTGLD